MSSRPRNRTFIRFNTYKHTQELEIICHGKFLRADIKVIVLDYL